MLQQNELRVFVSSTFLDLQEEREYLVRKVFPEIRDRCRGRGIVFTEVDLRWGVTEEEGTLGRIIRTCLEEIDRCRPYFIGITGDRYGYVPPLYEYFKDPELLREYPWLEDAAMENASIVDLEFRHALLNDVESGKKMARFYFRQGDGRREGDRLDELKKRMRDAKVSVREFHEPVELGRMVYEDLCGIIDLCFPDGRAPTPLESERARHEAFASSRRHAYIPNVEYIDALNRHAAGDGPPLVIHAESGSGKSALVAYWAMQYRRRHIDAEIVEYYVGIGSGVGDHLAIMRQIMAEIKERFTRDEEIPSQPEEMERSFANWLGFVRNGRLIVILDGVNQLQGAALNLAWLPKRIPSNVRLIVTSTIEQTLAVLLERGWSEMSVQPLTVAECEAAIVRYLAEYSKSLNVEQVHRIAEDRKSASPLFLRTLLEELRIYGSHKDLDLRIDYLLEATGTDDLFQRVLQRLEEDHGTGEMRVVMSLLWASRNGLSENELSEMTGVSRMRLSEIVLGLDYHLVRREAVLTFFHDYLRRAVEERYISDHSYRRWIYVLLADYFREQPTSQRTARELFWGLYAAGEHRRLAEALSTIEYFMAVYHGETEYEVARYWAEIGTEYDVEAMYRWALERWVSKERQEWFVVLDRVAYLLESLGRWEGALKLQSNRLDLVVEPPDEADVRAKMGRVMIVRGRYAEALVELMRARELSAWLGDRQRLSNVIGDIGIIRSYRGEHAAALECYREQEMIAHDLSDRRGVALAVGNSGIVHTNRDDYDAALECYRQAETLFRDLGDRRGIANVIGNMGILHARRGEYAAALKCYRQQEEIARDLGDRRGVATAVGNLGLLYFNHGEYDAALECYRHQELISRELDDRRRMATVIGNMGVLYCQMGEFDAALECYRRQQALCLELEDPRTEAFAIGNLGSVYSCREEFEEALICLYRAVERHTALGARAAVSIWLHELAQAFVKVVERLSSMPVFLTSFIPGIGPEDWRTMTLQRARTHIEECMAIDATLPKAKLQFSGQVLLAMIVAIEGNTGEAVRHLLELFSMASDDDAHAELHYRLWKLGAGGDDHGGRALQLYRRLFERTPNDDYRRRIEELASAVPAVSSERGDVAAE